MMVSHNLDPEIRALCLMLLEGLAAVVCEDSHVCPYLQSFSFSFIGSTFDN
jgi:hypothetical protein